MKKQIKTWKLLAESIRSDVPAMLLYVLESSGSSPGRQGFFMAVNANGEMEGSIGGGIMEHKFVEMAKERLAKTSSETDVEIRKQIHDKSASKDQSGMICSGEQTILLYPVKDEDLVSIEKLVGTLVENKNGKLQLSPKGLNFSESTPPFDYYFQKTSDENWVYEEKTGYKNQLTIIGGGHCALAFSQLMGRMDFYIRVYDERKNLKTMEENTWAHEKHVLNSYGDLRELVTPGGNHYVVIMSFGYRTDDIAVRALLGKSFKYLGLLGSKSKIEKMFEDYRKEGMDERWLQQIFSPVGISIKSQTPEEIAVSIAAEIISVKNKNR